MPLEKDIDIVSTMERLEIHCIGIMPTMSLGLNYKEMEKGIKYFIGTHDFKAFMASNSSVKSTVRTISKFYLEIKEDLIVFTIEGNGFLYNMVRIIVGTLVDVGREELKQTKFSNI